MFYSQKPFPENVKLNGAGPAKLNYLLQLCWLYSLKRGEVDWKQSFSLFLFLSPPYPPESPGRPWLLPPSPSAASSLSSGGLDGWASPGPVACGDRRRCSVLLLHGGEEGWLQIRRLFP